MSHLDDVFCCFFEGFLLISFHSIFQIDCEGCEYAAMLQLIDLISSRNARVNQIQIELHAVWDDNAQMMFDFFLTADLANFCIVHKERNH
jgi:hypothetical protein